MVWAIIVEMVAHKNVALGFESLLYFSGNPTDPTLERRP